jgi:hypothetical protein
MFCQDAPQRSNCRINVSERDVGQVCETKGWNEQQRKEILLSYCVLQQSHIPRAAMFEAAMFDDIAKTLGEPVGRVNSVKLAIEQFWAKFPDKEDRRNALWESLPDEVHALYLKVSVSYFHRCCHSVPSLYTGFVHAFCRSPPRLTP